MLILPYPIPDGTSLIDRIGRADLDPTLTVTSRAARRPDIDNGPGIRSGYRTTRQLEQDHPELAGRLTPPSGARLPAAASLRTDAGTGVRMLTINVHEGVPGGLDMNRDSNESLDALRDVARLVNTLDPDVVLVQELTSHPRGTWSRDVEEQPSILGRLMQADDVAFAPAFELGWGAGETGTAIYTRNGFQIEHSVNVALKDGTGTQPRGAAVARVSRPGRDADHDFTVIGTHLAHGSFNDAARGAQMQELASIVDGIRTSGGFDHTPRMPSGRSSSKQQRARGFARERIVLGGDLNSSQIQADDVLRTSGLRHVLTKLAASQDPADQQRAQELEQLPTATKNRIDHLYTSGWQVDDVGMARARNVDLDGDAPPTDHAAVIADLR
jgi:endonuclease/exonuclease/phosphatase family metal-dependent hydrolase